MSGRDWLAIIVVWAVGLFGVHQYDAKQASDAATTAATAVRVAAHKAATVVYKNGLLNCEGGNPTRKAQHAYFVSIAVGRSAEAKADDRPQAKAVDQGIARVAYHTARTYTNRFGARPDGTLICSQTVTHP